jgi:hypothetical protein
MHLHGQAAKQRGAATLFVVLVLLFAMTLITALSLRSALNQYRLSSNIAHSDRAEIEADAGLQNALAYLHANRSLVTATTGAGWRNSSNALKWTACSSATTSLPCGDGTSNLYGAGWQYFGPLPQQLDIAGDYSHVSYFLSDSVGDAWTDAPSLGCVNLGLTALLPAVTGALVGTVNTLLKIIHPSLGLPANDQLHLDPITGLPKQREPIHPGRYAREQQR